jgi:chaperonin GroEL
VLDKLKAINEDQQAGINIVKKALSAPVRQIAQNAGIDGAVVAGKLSESKDTAYIFDAQKLEYVDAFKAGIIDPAKVVRCALQDAASVAGLLITTEALVADLPEDDKAGSGGGHAHAGGMGGMGGMDF